MTLTPQFRSPPLPLAWCWRWAIISSWNLSTKVSWSSSTFWALPGYQSISWCEIASFDPDDLNYHPQHSCIPSNTKLVLVLCCTLSSMLSNLCYDLPHSITTFYVENVVVILPPLENSWYSNISRLLRSFPGLRVVSNRNTNKWSVMCKF